MGVSLATAEFLVEARERGADFTTTGTIGRQSLFIGPARAKRLLKKHGMAAAGMDFEATPGLLDPLLHALGASEILALDASPYEGADIVHDLNEPIPAELEQRFTTLFDGGSLEHIFDVPAALRNYLRMVKVGGSLIIHTMANNYVGHGFYQFSPELFFRVLTPENGYEIERVVLVENDLLWTRVFGATAPLEIHGPWYEVNDPAKVGGRILLRTKRPVVIQVQARRVADVPVLTRPVLQSDYVAQWDADADGADAGEVPADAEAGPAAAGAGAASGAGPIHERIGRRFPVEHQLSAKWDALPALYGLLRPWRVYKEWQLRSFKNERWFRRVR